MPSGDGTGPLGQGPMTGRAAGFCARNDTPGYTNARGGRGFGGGGRGFGRGRGGRGWRNRFYATGLTRWQRAAADPATEDRPQDAPVEASLHDRLRSLEQAIAAIREHIEGQHPTAGR